MTPVASQRPDGSREERDPSSGPVHPSAPAACAGQAGISPAGAAAVPARDPFSPADGAPRSQVAPAPAGLPPARLPPARYRAVAGTCARTLLRQFVEREIAGVYAERADHLLDLAESLLEMEETEEAIRVYERALAFPRVLVPAAAGLARALSRSGRAAEARATLRTILRLHADDAQTTRALLRCEAELIQALPGADPEGPPTLPAGPDDPDGPTDHGIRR